MKPNEDNVIVKGKNLECMFCKNKSFDIYKIKMNKKWLSIFDLELFSKSGKAYICKNCGFKHEFF